jgi:hypothetical protein
MGFLQNAIAISLAIAYSIILTPFSDNGNQMPCPMLDARFSILDSRTSIHPPTRIYPQIDADNQENTICVYLRGLGRLLGCLTKPGPCPKENVAFTGIENRASSIKYRESGRLGG